MSLIDFPSDDATIRSYKVIRNPELSQSRDELLSKPDHVSHIITKMSFIYDLLQLDCILFGSTVINFIRKEFGVCDDLNDIQNETNFHKYEDIIRSDIDVVMTRGAFFSFQEKYADPLYKCQITRQACENYWVCINYVEIFISGYLITLDIFVTNDVINMSFNVDFTCKSFLMWKSHESISEFTKMLSLNAIKINEYTFSTKTNITINTLIKATLLQRKSIFICVNALDVELRITAFSQRSYGTETIQCIPLELATQISHRETDCDVVSHIDLQDLECAWGLGQLKIPCHTPQCIGRSIRTYMTNLKPHISSQIQCCRCLWRHTNTYMISCGHVICHTCVNQIMHSMYLKYYSEITQRLFNQATNIVVI
jgi:hypothetical protein